jgi:hypothetical protein
MVFRKESMMRRIVYILGLLLVTGVAQSQKIESLHFNLYTDSLKKGVHNYINVDGKLSNGRFTPLDSKQLMLTASYGIWQGNDLIIDASYAKDSVVVTATLKADATIKNSITIYLKKNVAAEKLKTEKEILDELNKPRKKKG